MDHTISLPLWMVLLLSVGFAHAALFAWLIPGLRWYIGTRSSREADKKNSQLQIKIRPFQRTPRRVLVDRLKNDREVRKEIDKLVENHKGSRAQLEKKAHIYAKEIVPYFNAQMYFNIGFRLAKSVLRFLYRIKISAKDSTSLENIDANATIVFIMNHRSNMDYLLVSYLVADKVALSYAVGEWARVFPLEQIIKSLGAFFVRRISNDTLYRKVLERYVHMATEEGVSQAIYLEGGLSRDGNFQKIKLGYLDYILRSFDDKGQRDLVLVPVAINYDRVLEDNTMVRWNSPRNKISKARYALNVLHFIKDNMYIGARLRWRKFGYASVNFGIPISMRDYQAQRQFRFNELDSKQRFLAARELGEKVMDDIAHVMPVLPIPLLCSVFLRNSNTPLRSLDITSQVKELIREMIENGAAMKKREQPRNKTLQESLKLLLDRGMVLENDDYYQINKAYRPLNEYYANSIKHWLTPTTIDHEELTDVKGKTT